jgi:hypothetical protein
MKRAGALALLLAAGCTGTVADGGGSPGPGGGPGAPSTPGGPPGGGAPGGPSAPVPVSPCGNGEVPKGRTWRLTGTQFRNTALAVFGFVGPTTDQLPPDGQPEGFANQADRLSVQPLLASKYLLATEEIAASVTARSGEFLSCPLAALGTGTCLRDFLNTVGTRAWRRPLTPAEIGKYTALHGTLVQGNTPEVAFQGLVQALILSPNFLFRTELGSGAAGTVSSLTDYELASAISYMLLDGPPDAMLMQLAGSGKLHDPATLGAQARRLLASGPRAAGMVGGFFQQWLQFDTLAAMPKDGDLFPQYTPEVVDDLVAESQAMVQGVLFDPAADHSLKTLLTAPYGYVSSRTAPLYGVQASGTALARTNLPASQRRGFLTQASFIAGASDPDDTNLPTRGRILREQVLCQPVAPPPGNFSFDESKITPDMTTREKFIVHTTNPACASCHSLFDGIGYAMELYDPIGRYRTMDKGKPIDSTGSVPLAGGMLSFSNYVDFIDQITKLPETYQCVATQYDAYATGRAPADIGQCEGDTLARAFSGGSYKLESLVAAIVSSPNFALRRN